jgi:hypothetical protein
MKWVTRKDIKVDRTACPWLIRRFLDPEAEFLFVEEKDVLTAAAREEAVPFDLPRHPELKFTHHEGLCTFEVLLREFDLDDPALARMAKIVHAAELRGQDSAAEGPGLKAIAEGFHLLAVNDEKRLAWGFPVYDALYAWCQKHPHVK